MAGQQFFRAVFVVSLFAFSASADAQYSMVGTPFQNGGYSYYEGVNLGWGISGRGWNFNWNNGVANPPFGQFDPNANAQIGGAFRNGPVSGSFHLTAGQGSNTSMVSQTPSVVVPNGGVGFVSDTTQRPFVAGVVPVVNDAYYRTALQERLSRLRAAAAEQESQGLALGKKRSDEGNITPQPTAVAGGIGPSTAERGDVSVAEIKSRQAAQNNAGDQELAAILAKAETLDKAGDVRIARIYYQQAIRRTTGEQQQRLKDRVSEIDRGK